MFVIANLASPNKTMFLDLSKHVRVGGDEGLFALALTRGTQPTGSFSLAANLRVCEHEVNRFPLNPALLPVERHHVGVADAGTPEDIQSGTNRQVDPALTQACHFFEIGERPGAPGVGCGNR